MIDANCAGRKGKIVEERTGNVVHGIESQGGRNGEEVEAGEKGWRG